jgi:pimeloyl-ACP methyl ester carboxylesterase
LSLLIALAGASIVLVLAGLLYQAIGTRLDTRRCSAPGRLIDAGHGLVHVQDAGEGSPAVVLEAGIAASSLSWTPVHRGLASMTRVISYDRPGLGWSAAPRTSRTAENMTAELRSVLEKLGAAPPYILVGHSFGGLLVAVYASLYPSEVCGLILVDPVSAAEWASATPKQLAMLRRGVRLSRRGALLARFGVVRFALSLLMAGGRMLPKTVAVVSSGRGAGVTQRLVGEVRKLPEELWPLIRSHWCRPGCFTAMAAYLESLPANAVSRVAAFLPDHIPVTVLSAADASETSLAEHRSLAEGSRSGRHIIAEKSGHWILLDQPELVVASVKEMLEGCRSGNPLRPL